MVIDPQLTAQLGERGGHYRTFASACGNHTLDANVQQWDELPVRALYQALPDEEPAVPQATGRSLAARAKRPSRRYSRDDASDLPFDGAALPERALDEAVKSDYCVGGFRHVRRVLRDLAVKERFHSVLDVAPAAPPSTSPPTTSLRGASSASASVRESCATPRRSGTCGAADSTWRSCASCAASESKGRRRVWGGGERGGDKRRGGEAASGER
eukprot:7385626-Prymnesium_polylepis.1